MILEVSARPQKFWPCIVQLLVETKYKKGLGLDVFECLARAAKKEVNVVIGRGRTKHRMDF